MLYSKLFIFLLMVIILLIASLFSFLETAIVSISKYKLKVLKTKYKWAVYAEKLKDQINNVLIFSLFGNSLFNAIFTVLNTAIISQYFKYIPSNILLPIITFIISIVIIILSEAVPKIIASKSPDMVLKYIAIPLYYLFYLSKVIIYLINFIIHYIIVFLKVSGINNISKDELKSIISDDSSPFTKNHKTFLINSIDLIEITVKEVLIPLRLVKAINLDDDLDLICKVLFSSVYTQIIVYDKKIENIVGYIHVKDLLSCDKEKISKEYLLTILRPIQFIYDFTPIVRQIETAQASRSRIFVVINEYGDILGIACLEDLFEIVFGDFTTESPQRKTLVYKNDKGEFIVDGTMLIRELNELYNLNIKFNWNSLTINGLVLKELNYIPKIGTCFKLNNLIFEIISVGQYWVERVKVIKIKH